MRRYIKKIYQAAVEAGKTVIATSDMYWPKEYIEKLLIQCGYTNLEYIFVSCDIKKSKYSGEMFRCLKQEKFKEKKICAKHHTQVYYIARTWARN